MRPAPRRPGRLRGIFRRRQRDGAPYGDTPPGGYRKRRPEEYDRTLCLLPRDVVDVVLVTQPREWKKLEQHHGAAVRSSSQNASPPMNRMYNPPHPGEILKDDVLPSLGLTVTDAAQQLRITRVALSRVLNGKAAISPDMALRLAAWLDTSAEVWLRIQVTFDLRQASKARRPRIVRARNAA